MTEFISNPNQSERKEKFFSVDINHSDLVTFEDIEHACEIVERFVEANSEVNPYEARVYARLQNAIYTLIGNAKDSIEEVSELNSKIINQKETIDDLNEICEENDIEIKDLVNETKKLSQSIVYYKSKKETLENELEKLILKFQTLMNV